MHFEPIESQLLHLSMIYAPIIMREKVVFLPLYLHYIYANQILFQY